MADEIVYVEGTDDILTLWFSGPRPAGDFIAHWFSHDQLLRHCFLPALQPWSQYVAIRPDDMLDVQEWNIANEGLDTHSNLSKLPQ